jgi:hypothetical protein
MKDNQVLECTSCHNSVITPTNRLVFYDEDGAAVYGSTVRVGARLCANCVDRTQRPFKPVMNPPRRP